MREFIRQIQLWRVRRAITQAIRRIQAAEKMAAARSSHLQRVEDDLRVVRMLHNP